MYVFSEAEHFPHRLDVQETNVSIPRFYRIRNYFVGCWIENGRTTCFWLMRCGDRSVTFIEQYQITQNQARSRKLSACSRKGSLIKTQTEGKPRRGSIVACGPCYHKRTLTLLKVSLSCTFLKITKLWSRWSWRAEVQQWDTFQELTELRLIGYLIESMWTPRSKSNMLTQQSNSLTYWPSGISHVMSGTIFFVCKTSWFFNVFLQPSYPFSLWTDQEAVRLGHWRWPDKVFSRQATNDAKISNTRKQERRDESSAQPTAGNSLRKERSIPSGGGS